MTDNFPLFTVPLLFSDHRSHLAQLRAAALRAVDPASAVQRFFSPADFAEAGRVFVVGAGKAGVAMAQAAAEILGERLASGVVAVPRLPSPGGRGAGGERKPPGRITFLEGGHPAPTPGSLAAGRAAADLLARTAPRDLVVALISGGGSALLELPLAGLTLADLQTTNDALLKSGATINEVNTVRAQLSQLKGGGLARLARPARVLALILSDVVRNPLDIIASGPTVPSTAARQDALAVIDKYNLRSTLPASVLQHLTAGLHPSSFSLHPSVENRLIASNRQAGEAAATTARALGFDATLLADDWQGEAREVGRRFAERVASPPTPVPSPLSPALSRGEGRGVAKPGRGGRCLIVGGESTVTVRGHGKGGRNQEAALAAAMVIDGLPDIVISTFATDGVDGPTDAAGAIVTGDTLTRARALGLDPQKHLDDNDAYTFFAALGDLIITGPTGTNVNDLIFGLVYWQG